MVTDGYSTIWFPGVYTPRTEGVYAQKVADISLIDLTVFVQERVKEDGEWAIANHLVGEHEEKMRRMMEFVSDEKNIRQCVEHIRTEGTDHERTVDWVCRELAKASKMMIQ